MRRLLAAATAVAIYLVIGAAPASATASPLPQARLVGTGLIRVGQSVESYIKVKARDVDGIITEIDVLWGDNSVSFASSYPCLIKPTPKPGTPHRFLVSHRYDKPGRYTVKYVVYSISDCSPSAFEQHSTEYTAQLIAP
jgi:hypothetical protein